MKQFTRRNSKTQLLASQDSVSECREKECQVIPEGRPTQQLAVVAPDPYSFDLVQEEDADTKKQAAPGRGTTLQVGALAGSSQL
jgi:hypothetical protein